MTEKLIKEKRLHFSLLLKQMEWSGQVKENKPFSLPNLQIKDIFWLGGGRFIISP